MGYSFASETACIISNEDQIFYLKAVHAEYVRDGDVSELEEFDQWTTAMRLQYDEQIWDGNEE